MEIRTFGNGNNTILFLHGWGCDGNIFKDFIEDFRYNYKLLIPDLYGFGKSELPRNVKDIYSYTLELYLYLKEKKIKELSIIAHSFGGRIAIILASCFNIKIKGLFLISCAGIKPRRHINYYLKIYIYKFFKKINNKKLLKIYNKKFLPKDLTNVNCDLKNLFVKVVNQDLTYLLKNIKCRTFIIYGKKDKATPIYMAKILNKNIKNSTVFIIKNTGHYCFIDKYFYIVNIIKSNII